MCTCAHISVCMFLCLCAHVFMYTFMCLPAVQSVVINLHGTKVLEHVYIDVCIRVCYPIYVCGCVCLYVIKCVCACVCTCHCVRVFCTWYICVSM
ncbi:hypothetical protein KP509_01G114000 [Ceratopteris richardii]|uniref:Secreted protein n=1 Tax=Ceratopteris richardii TaxID=49495 RepID=A0A8T2VQ29_CERRI|nr:hypothetical protein KP509_01G114000 [Ceratopteris richardii]